MITSVLSQKRKGILYSTTLTCWQMLAYRASTLAFSKMASSDGVVSLIFSTQRHLAKSAPSFLYCAHRSDSPSRPALKQRTEPAMRNTQGFREVHFSSQTCASTVSYPEWWSLHLFQRGVQHPCQPVKTNRKCSEFDLK